LKPNGIIALVTVTGLILSTYAVLAPGAGAIPPSNPDTLTDPYLVNVGFDGDIPSNISSRVDTEGGILQKVRPEIGLAIIRTKSGVSQQDLIARMRNYSDTRYAVADLRTSMPYIPNDPYYHATSPDRQWAVDHIGAPAAWSLTLGSAAVKMADVDFGVDCFHPDFARTGDGGAALPYCDPTSNAMVDSLGHGTAVAGIMGATINNQIGIAGLSQSTLISLQAASYGFNDPALAAGNNGEIAYSIVLAVLFGAKIVNVESQFGCANVTLDVYTCQPLRDAVVYASDHGALVVAPTGNTDHLCVQPALDVRYPAAYPEVIAVGAVAFNNQRPCWSKYGPEIDLVAPGERIISTIPLNGGSGCDDGLPVPPANYCVISGTSFASPHVAGSAALLWSYRPCLSRDTVKALLLDHAQVLGSELQYGRGLVRIDQAMAAAPSC
jgi:subtilisin family serine protease